MCNEANKLDLGLRSSASVCCVQSLVGARARCDSQLTDAEGYAPAHYAAREGHARSLAALLEGGAEKAGINARDPAFGSTPVRVVEVAL